MDGAAVTVPVSAERDTRLEFEVGDSVVHTAAASGGEQPISFTLGDGRHKVTVRATDGAGNTSPSAEFTVDLDTTPPELPVVEVDVGREAGAKTSLTLSGERDSDYQVQLTGPSEHSEDGDISDGETDVSWLLPNGDYTATTTLTDKAGNTSAPATVPFTVDLPAPDAPTVSVVSDPGATPIEVAVDAGGAETVLVSLLGEAAAKEEAVELDRRGRGAVDFAVPDGRFSVVATAVDFQEQESRSVREGDIVVDTEAPMLNLAFLDGLLAEGVFAYRLRTEDGALVEVASDTEALVHRFVVDGDRWQEFTFDVPGGEHLVTVSVTDEFGNETVREFTAAVTTPFGAGHVVILALMLAILIALGLAVRILVRHVRHAMTPTTDVGLPLPRPPGLTLPPPPT